MMELLLVGSLRCCLLCSVSLLMMMKLGLAEFPHSTLSSSASCVMQELLLAEPCLFGRLCSALSVNLLLCQEEERAPGQGSLAGHVHSDRGLGEQSPQMMAWPVLQMMAWQVLQMMALQVLQMMACVILMM